ARQPLGHRRPVGGGGRRRRPPRTGGRGGLDHHPRAGRAGHRLPHLHGRGPRRPPLDVRPASLGDRGEHAGEGTRDLARLHRLDEQRRIAEVTAAVLQPAAQLSLGRPPPPVDLVLKAAERVELALCGNDILDTLGTQRADQLVLEILDANMRRVAEDASEPALLAGVAEPDGTLSLVLGGSPPDRLRAADRNDLDPTEVQAEPPRDCLERDAVGDAFDEDDRHAPQASLSPWRPAATSFNWARSRISRPGISSAPWPVPCRKALSRTRSSCSSTRPSSRSAVAPTSPRSCTCRK